MERVEALLLWQDPYASAKVFGAGLYILICLRHLVCGEHSIVILPILHVHPVLAAVFGVVSGGAEHPEQLSARVRKTGRGHLHGSVTCEHMMCILGEFQLSVPLSDITRKIVLGRTFGTLWDALDLRGVATQCTGVELLQPSTALAGLALFALLYAALARLWSARRSPLRHILDRHPLPHEEEAQLQASFLLHALHVPHRLSQAPFDDMCIQLVWPPAFSPCKRLCRMLAFVRVRMAFWPQLCPLEWSLSRSTND